VRAATGYPLGDEDVRLRARCPEVEQAIDDPAYTIVDVRTVPEFVGERFWPSGALEEGGRAGHIPSALNIPIDGLYDDVGAYRSAADLARLFAPIDPSRESELITYCTIGGRACTAWFVLTYLLGRERVRVYDGSWAEWGRMPATPVTCV
jgi:thiosulfate/3-mercaptopyruvate sulfurtransferase